MKWKRFKYVIYIECGKENINQNLESKVDLVYKRNDADYSFI